jgi:hypothetical protein
LSVRAKQSVVFAGLAAMALWPLAHHALVRRFEISPWKFFGWAMYCAPAGRMSALLYPVEGGGTPASWAGTQPAAVTEAIGDYLNRRRSWGLLLPPDRVAEAVFRSAPELRAVRINVRVMALDPDSALLAWREHDYTYRRDGQGGE